MPQAVTHNHAAAQHDALPVLALAGNPNSGKTTLFNALTGMRQYVGNWPGVTVERKEGSACVAGQDARIVDLPGIYSLSPYSLEENVSRNYILNDKPDCIISIVDATNLVRNLYLTIQLIEMNRPMAVALNMMDEVRARGDSIDVEKLSKALGVPVIPITARAGEGVDAIFTQAMRSIAKPTYSDHAYDAPVERAISQISEHIRPVAEKLGWPLRWSALAILEGSGAAQELLQDASISRAVSRVSDDLEREMGLDHQAIVAEQRYHFAAEAAGASVKHGKPGQATLTEKIDRVLCSPNVGLPIFALIMLGIFQVTFGPVGAFLQGLLESLIGWIGGLAEVGLTAVGAAEWLKSLILGGIIEGVGSVLSFAPLMLILYLFMSMLEDSGYMARAAFLMDGVMSRVGLSGRAFIPMLMGFGCSVPALSAARALNSERDRRLTMMIVPFMSCGAKMPIYIVFIGAFFGHLAGWMQGLVMFSIYAVGILVALLVAFVLQKTALKAQPSSFLMEMPTYRLPTFKGTARRVVERLSDFLVRAGTIILTSMVVIWFLQYFTPTFQYAEDPQNSMLGALGSFIAPIFRPNGFGNWQAAISLLTGLIAKENVVGTMGQFLGFDPEAVGSSFGALAQAFTPLSAYAFMIFCLLYVPCMAAVAAMKREMGSWRWTLGTVGMQIGVAYVASMLIFQVGRLFGLQ